MPVPEAVDYRDVSGVVRPVRDQQDCGSCWAFAATEALEGQLGLAGRPMTLAPQVFVDCVKQDYGCGGGWPEDALAFAEERGVVPEGEYPYTANSTGYCRMEGPGVSGLAPMFKARAFYEVRAAGNNHKLRHALWKLGPLSVTLDASGFDGYSGGIANGDDCSKDTPDHAVLLVGYRGAENRNDSYWLIKNSWGASWGEEGFIRLNASQDNPCGIANQAAAVEV